MNRAPASRRLTDPVQLQGKGCSAARHSGPRSSRAAILPSPQGWTGWHYATVTQRGASKEMGPEMHAHE